MWTCWHVDVLWMGADMDPCKKKKKQKEREKRKAKRKKYILLEVGVSMRMGRVEALSCRRVDGHADVWTCGCGQL